jgi:hypothetical protein
VQKGFNEGFIDPEEPKGFKNPKKKAFRNFLLRKALSECGKQDLNLHGLTATRPSTGGGIFRKSLWHNDKQRRGMDLDCVSFPVVPPGFAVISYRNGGAVGALLALGFGAIFGLFGTRFRG